MWCYDRTGRRFPPLPGSDSVQVPPYTLPRYLYLVSLEEEGVLQTCQSPGLEVDCQIKGHPIAGLDLGTKTITKEIHTKSIEKKIYSSFTHI